MPEIKHRQTGGSPETEYAEIHIPDDQNMGDGTFTTVLKPNALSKDKAIVSMMLKAPAFQISVNINPAPREIPVLLGRADGSEPSSKKVFVLSPDIDVSKSHTFMATFKNWEITSLKLNELPLVEK